MVSNLFDPTSRRSFLGFAGKLATVSAASALLGCGVKPPTAATDTLAPKVPAIAGRPNSAADPRPPGPADLAMLNYALNLQYLAAQFYSYAVSGSGIAAGLTDGTGSAGDVRNGHRVPFRDPAVARYAAELADDKIATLASLRTLTADAAVTQPHIDLAGSATLPTASGAVDPFVDDASFLRSALVFEDASARVFRDLLVRLEGDASAAVIGNLLADTNYHAGLLRTTLLGYPPTQNADQEAATVYDPSGSPTTGGDLTAGQSACAGDSPPASCLHGATAALARYFPNDVNGTIKFGGDQS